MPSQATHIRYATLLCLLLSACSTPNYYPHEARENSHIGQGGSRFTTDGIEVWFIGAPDRRYAILGYIEDTANDSAGASNKYVSADVLKKAREINADALIEVVTQASNSNSGISSGILLGGRGAGGILGFEFPVRNYRSVRYTAIKYITDQIK